jgi:hypothetical protein
MALVDRIALGLFVLVAIIMFAMGETGPNPNFLNAEWWQSYFDIMFVIGVKFLVPIWLVLRLLDALAGGPARRRGAINARLID